MIYTIAQIEELLGRLSEPTVTFGDIRIFVREIIPEVLAELKAEREKNKVTVKALQTYAPMPSILGNTAREALAKMGVE